MSWIGREPLERVHPGGVGRARRGLVEEVEGVNEKLMKEDARWVMGRRVAQGIYRH